MLNIVPPSMSSSQRNHLITEAMCCLIANALSALESSSLDQSSQTPYWKKVIDQGLRHKNSSVQEAAAQAMLSLSKLKDCTHEVERYVFLLLLLFSVF